MNNGRLTNIIGMNGSGMVRVCTTISAGRGTRDIPVDLEPKLIVRLAYLLEATKDGACDTSTSRIVDGDRNGYHVGHAVWHLRNPERAVPCIDPAMVIDMRSLPSGEDAE